MSQTPPPTFETVDAAVKALKQTLSSNAPVGQEAIQTVRTAITFLEAKVTAREIDNIKGAEIVSQLQEFLVSARTLLTLALQGQQNTEGIEGLLRLSRLLSTLHGTRY